MRVNVIRTALCQQSHRATEDLTEKTGMSHGCTRMDKDQGKFKG
jgi:hypothetical protein